MCIRDSAGAPVFGKLPARAAGRILMGMDVGGTDVKLAASVDGALRVFKEYDLSLIHI